MKGVKGYEEEVDHNSICVSENGSKSDEKGGQEHWSTTENGALVARATAFVYRKIIASKLEGGLREFVDENCPLFIDADKEQKLLFTDIYNTYERHIERLLDDFAASEGTSQVDIMQRIEEAISENKAAGKSLEMLLAATNYTKFSKMMHRKALEKSKKDEEMAQPKSTTAKQPSPPLSEMSSSPGSLWSKGLNAVKTEDDREQSRGETDATWLSSEGKKK